jgi:type IV pilus assembly protein PilF
MRTAELAAIQHNFGWFLCQQNRFADSQAQFDQALAQSSYRQADKTRQATALCKARASLITDNPLRLPAQ